MKPNRFRKYLCSSLPSTAFVAITAAAISTTFAADVVWDGNTDSDGGDGITFDSGLNWSTDAIPSVATPDNGVFNGTVAGALSLSYGGAINGASPNVGIGLNLAATQTSAVTIDSGAVATALRISGITISSGAGALTLGNSADAFNITLGGGASTQTFTNNSTNVATFRSDAVMSLGGGGNHLLNFAGSGDWAVASNMAFASGGQGALYKTGAGTLTLSGGGALKEGAAVNGGPFYSAVLKQGTTVFDSGTYTNNITTNNGEFVIGGLDTVGTDTQVTLNNAAILNGIEWLSVGRGNGTGTTSNNLTLNGSSAITTVNLSAGFNGGNASTAPKGVVTLNGTSSISVANTVNFAESAGSNFTLNLNDTSTFSQTANAAQTRIGQANGAVGAVNVNGGTANFERDVTFGYAGTGTGSLVLTTGTVNMATTATRWMKVGELNGASGTVTVNGGNINLNTNSSLKFAVGASSTGINVVTLNGGAITAFSDNKVTATGSGIVDLNTAGAAASSNTFNLNGGTLAVRAVVTTSDAATAAFNFNGGTLKATGNDANFVNLGGATQTANVLSGGANINSNGFNVTIVEGLKAGSPSGGLAKSGAGTLTLSGTSTYTGVTSVNGGTLVITGTINASSAIAVNGSGAGLVVNNGFPGVTAPATITSGKLDGTGAIDTAVIGDDAANIVTAGNANAGTLTVSNLEFQGDAQLNLRATGTYMDQSINVLTSLKTTGANGKVVVNATNTDGLWTSSGSGYDYTLINYSSATFTGSAADFQVGTVPGLNSSQTASIVDTGSSIVLRITGEPLIWTGSTSADWNTTQNNWSYLGNPISYTTGSPVEFTDGASQLAVNLSSNVSPGAIVFSNYIDSYTISSTGGFGITGSGTLTLNGGGQVTLTTDNTYTGLTNIISGTLIVSGNGSINDSSSIALGTSGQLVLNNSVDAIYANPITGTGSFMGAVIKQGTNALTLSGANTFTGGFTLESGRLNLNSATALGNPTGTFILNGGSLDNTSGTLNTMTPAKPQQWNTDVNFIGTNALNMGNGAVTLTASRTVDVQASTLYTGVLVDMGSGYNLTKVGAGKLVLNGTNITGNIDIQAGIVGVNQDVTAGALLGTGILQNNGDVGTKWAYLTGNTDVSTNLLIRNNDGTNTRQLGIVKQGSGTLTLTNASNVVTANIGVESGKLVLSAGTYGAQNDDGSTNAALTSLIGSTASANGVLVIDGPTLNYNNRGAGTDTTFRHTLDIGNNATGAGALHLKSGGLSTFRQFTVGNTNGSFGAYRQSSGTTASVGGFLAVGLGTSQGVFNLEGGTFTMTTAPVTNGAGAGGIGVMNLSGTAVFNHNAAAANAVWLGENGAGILNISGSAALNVPSNGVELGRSNVATASGTLNLLGGTVTANSVSKPGAAATGILNFNGGTLAANISNASFMTGLTNAYVHSGGGTISNGGNSITIGQALLAPTGNGVSASGLTVSGGGYIATPIVTITGDGTGATAVATIDSTGNLTGITVTNPGVGYTVPPTFTLSGGGVSNTGAIGGTATLVASSSGSLAFTGAGATTLTGMNTYTGNTSVGTGSTLVVTNSGALTVKPTSNGVSSKITGAGTVGIDGTLRVDLTSAAIANNNTWTLVDVAAKSYNVLTFKVSSTTLGDFTAQGDGVTHTLIDGNNTWTYSETTGQLILTVTTPGGYNSWIGGFGLPLADQDPTDDPDQDGVANLVEYALGRNPAVSEGAASTVVKNGANLELTFNRSDLATTSGDASIFVSYGTDLTGWTDVAVPAASGSAGGVAFTISNGTPNDTVVASIPTASATKFFARVKVVK